MADSSRQLYINYGSFADHATRFENKNKEMQDTLSEIMKKISELNLNGQYQSNAAEAIRDKILGMKPRFDQYQQVVQNYVTFVRRTAESYSTTEQTNVNNASRFK